MSPDVVTLLVAAGAVFAIVKVLFGGLAVLVGDDGDALLRKRLDEFSDQLDRSTLGEALWWLVSSGLARLSDRIHDRFAAGLLMLLTCVFFNCTAFVLGAGVLLKDDPAYVNSARFIPLVRDILYEFFHVGAFVADLSVLSGALATWLASLMVWRILRWRIDSDGFLRQLIGRLAVSIVIALAAGCVPFLMLRWALLLQLDRGFFSQFEFHLAYVLATSPDASKVLVFSAIASAAAALPAVLMSVGVAVALYLYGSPRFLRDASLRAIQVVTTGKTGIVSQLGNLAGALGALAGAVVTLLSLS